MRCDAGSATFAARPFNSQDTVDGIPSAQVLPHDERREALYGFAGRRKQIEESSSCPTAHVAEGFGRFNPADFARFCVIARSSLMESQNHLLDFVDKRYISEEVRLESVESPRAPSAEARPENRERARSPGELRTEPRTEPRNACRTEHRTVNRTMKVNTNRELRRQKSEQQLAFRRSKVSH